MICRSNCWLRNEISSSSKPLVGVISQIREFGSPTLISPMGSPVIRQWHTPILVEGARSDLDPWGRVATNPLGFVDAAHHLCDRDRVETGIDEVLEAGGVLDVALDDIVEHFVGWQALWEGGLRTAS